MANTADSDDSNASNTSSEAQESVLTRATTVESLSTSNVADEIEPRKDASANEGTVDNEDPADTVMSADERSEQGSDAQTAGPKKLSTEDEYEGESTLEIALKNDIYFGVTSRTLSDGKSQSRRRNLQSISYFVMVEARIKELEKQVEDMKTKASKSKPTDSATEKAVDSAEEDTTTEKKERWSLEPRWMSLLDFVEPPRYPVDPEPFIDVLTEPMAPLPGRRGQYIEDETNRPQHEADEVEKEETKHPLRREVHRIRVNSEPICDVLRDVMKDFNAPTPGSVHIAPFKIFLAFEEDLRKVLVDLDEKLAEHVAAGEATTEDASTGDAANIIDGEAEADHVMVPEPNAERARMMERAKHLRALLLFMDYHLRDEIATYKHFRRREAVESDVKISFPDLWKLYAPGDIVYLPFDRQALKVVAVRGGRRVLRNQVVGIVEGNETATTLQEPEPSDFTLDCFYMGFDGKDVGPIPRESSIRPYDGTRSVKSLPAIPIEYVQHSKLHGFPAEKGDPILNGISVQEQLVERGKKFSQLACPNMVVHREYEGLSLGDFPEQIDSEVIIDLEKYFLTKPTAKPELGLLEGIATNSYEVSETCRVRCRCADSTCRMVKEDDLRLYDDRTVDSFLEDRELKAPGSIQRWISADQEQLRKDFGLLFPQQIHGFVLKNRHWHALEVGKVQTTKKLKDGFKDLILPDGHKEIVKSLVEEHGSGANTELQSLGNRAREDLVRGKGKGLIILLHGVPGVGKTSTAETVAEYCNRPLFALTCGDIGETPEKVQEKLKDSFSLAYRWNCVMLLDEADVFLAAREKTDMKRNAVVSVFLRSLEYYSGILFLTTNKVGVFDEAFKSRIHVSLYYKSLDKKQTEEIWRVNLRRIREVKKGLNFDDEVLIKWVKKSWKQMKQEDRQPWNGRQIHNAVRTAAALATYQSKEKEGEEGAPTVATLTVDHLMAVEKASQDFDKYLLEVHGADDAERAARDMERADDTRTKNIFDDSRSVRSTPAKSKTPRSSDKHSTKKKKTKKPRSPSESESESEQKKSNDDKTDSDASSDED